MIAICLGFNLLSGQLTINVDADSSNNSSFCFWETTLNKERTGNIMIKQ